MDVYSSFTVLVFFFYLVAEGPLKKWLLGGGKKIVGRFDFLDISWAVRVGYPLEVSKRERGSKRSRM